MKRIIGSLLLCILLLTGCSAAPEAAAETPMEPQSASRDVFAMDTYITVTCYGDRCEAAAEAAVAEIERLDDLLSIGNPESEISQINAAGSGTLSGETAAMVEQSLELYGSTNGAFDITVLPLMELWGFTDGEFAVPDEAALADCLSRVGSGRLTYDSASAELTLGVGQSIDLGGIAKGFTSDRLMEIFAEYELTSGMVSLGGNVQLYGTKPDGSLWRCGIVDPFAPESGIMGVLTARDCAVITSGPYERYFADESGNLYHHILDPETGYPADSGLVSVTIVSESGMLADGLSTSCYLLGLEGASQYWRAWAGEFDMILMTADGTVYITEPLRDRFTTDYPLCVIGETGTEP